MNLTPVCFTVPYRDIVVSAGTLDIGDTARSRLDASLPAEAMATLTLNYPEKRFMVYASGLYMNIKRIK